MWGRELRAGLVFVLASLLAGSGFREWRRSHEPRFAEIVSELESQDAATRGASRSDSTGGAAPGGAAHGAARSEGAGRRPSEALVPSRIDIERATAAELERLPGIGPALAARIVAERVDHGPFRSPAGLLRVRGIGPRTLARILPYLSAPPGAVDSGSPIAN